MFFYYLSHFWLNHEGFSVQLTSTQKYDYIFCGKYYMTSPPRAISPFLPFSLCLSVCLSVHLSNFHSLSLSLCLSLCLSLSLSLCLSVSLSLCLSLFLSPRAVLITDTCEPLVTEYSIRHAHSTWNMSVCSGIVTLSLAWIRNGWNLNRHVCPLEIHLRTFIIDFKLSGLLGIDFRIRSTHYKYLGKVWSPQCYWSLLSQWNRCVFVFIPCWMVICLLELKMQSS